MSPVLSFANNACVVISPKKRWKRRAREAHLATSIEIEEKCRLKRGREFFASLKAEKKQKTVIGWQWLLRSTANNHENSQLECPRSRESLDIPGTLWVLLTNKP